MDFTSRSFFDSLLLSETNTFMKNTTLFYTILLSFFACKQDMNRTANEEVASIPVQLVCEDIGSTDELPKYAVYAIISERKTKMLEVASGCQVIEKEQYGDFQIPMDAAMAVGGWWAGAGDYFYAQSTDNKVVIFHAVIDEAQTDTDYNYQKIATYKDGRFTVNPPILQ